MKTPFFIIIFLLIHFHLFAQWESMHGPFGSFINDLGQNEHYVFAATTAGLYRSADAGITWINKSFTGDARFSCLQFDVFDSLLIADAVEIRPDTFIRRMFKSVDEGDTWIEIPRPMANNFVEIAVVGKTIFANDQQTIWISQNDGLLWKHSNVNHSISYPACFERFGSKVYVGSGKDLFVYEGLDNNWKKITIGIANYVDDVFVNDSLILVRDYGKEDLYISEDNGITWFNSPGTQWDSFENYFAAIGDTLYATGYETIYVSADHGHTWESRNSKSPHPDRSLIAVNTILLMGQEYSGMYRSTDFGRQFHYSSDGMDATFVEKLFLYNDELLTGGILQGVFNYNFQSSQWQESYFDEYAENQCFDFEESNGHLVMAAYDVLWFEPATSEWIKNSPEAPGIYTDLFISPYGLMAGGNRTGTTGPLSVFTALDYWDDFYFQFDNAYPYLFSQNTQCQFVAESDRVARSFDDGQHWEWMPSFIDPHTSILDMISLDNAIYVIQTDEPPEHTRLYVSYDNGTSWAIADSGIPAEGNNSGPLRLIEIGNYLLCCTQGSNSGIYFSTKDQLQWHSFNEGLPYLNIRDVVSDGEYVYAAVSGKGVWKRKVDEIKITNTQDEKLVRNSTLQLFPNPTNEQFYIHLNASELIGARLKMYDLQGKVVLDKVISDPGSAIEAGGLPNGLYGIELNTSAGYYMAKLVVQH